MGGIRAVIFRRIVGTVLALCAVSQPARGQYNLFEVFVQDIGGGGTPDLTVGGSSLPDLINNLVNAQDEFASFAGVEFSADITVAGVPNAINITVDPAGMTATLTFTILGPSAQTFNFSGADLQGQIEQFLQNNLSEQLTAFLGALNTLSAVAITDGSPISSTAQSADFVFERFGLHSDFTAWERRNDNFEHTAKGLSTRVDAYYDRIDTADGNGDSYSLVTSMQYTFDEHMAIAFQLPVNYTDIEGARVVNLHADLVLPINLTLPNEVMPFGLRVTPFATMSATGSVDFAAGGVLAGGGLLGTVVLDLGSFYASASAQISAHESLTLQYGGFEFDPGISQQIVKVGFKATQQIDRNFFVYGTITYTSFLQPAAVDQYLTPGVGFGYRTPAGFNISAGYSGDIGNGFNAQQIRATIQLPF